MIAGLPITHWALARIDSSSTRYEDIERVELKRNKAIKVTQQLLKVQCVQLFVYLHEESMGLKRTSAISRGSKTHHRLPPPSISPRVRHAEHARLCLPLVPLCPSRSP